MKAWPAADELRTDGVLDAVLGVGMLVAALALGANPLWLLPLAALLAVLSRRPIRHMSDELAATHPAPPEFTVRGPALVVARVAPEPLVWTGFVILAGLTSSPLMIGLGAVVSLFGAAVSLGRAREIARWESQHGGRVVRTRGDLWVAH